MITLFPEKLTKEIEAKKDILGADSEEFTIYL